MSAIAGVQRVDSDVLVLDQRVKALAPGAATVSFNSRFGEVLLNGELCPDEAGWRFVVDREQSIVRQRRETFRVPLVAKARVRRLDDGQEFDCQALDLSIGGALLKTPRMLMAGEALTLTISLPGEELTLDALVARREREGELMGVQFHRMEGATERRLARVVADAQRLLLGRSR